MGSWTYIGKKEIECPHCKKAVEIEVRIKPKA